MIPTGISPEQVAKILEDARQKCLQPEVRHVLDSVARCILLTVPQRRHAFSLLTDQQIMDLCGVCNYVLVIQDYVDMASK